MATGTVRDPGRFTTARCHGGLLKTPPREHTLTGCTVSGLAGVQARPVLLIFSLPKGDEGGGTKGTGAKAQCLRDKIETTPNTHSRQTETTTADDKVHARKGDDHHVVFIVLIVLLCVFLARFALVNLVLVFSFFTGFFQTK
jgi:hypothetical protein